MFTLLQKHRNCYIDEMHHHQLHSQLINKIYGFYLSIKTGNVEAGAMLLLEDGDFEVHHTKVWMRIDGNQLSRKKVPSRKVHIGTKDSLYFYSLLMNIDHDFRFRPLIDISLVIDQ